MQLLPVVEEQREILETLHLWVAFQSSKLPSETCVVGVEKQWELTEARQLRIQETDLLVEERTDYLETGLVHIISKSVETEKFSKSGEFSTLLLKKVNLKARMKIN